MTEPAIPKTEEIIMKEAIDKLKVIGSVVEEGKNRGFSKHDILYLIGTGIIKI